MRSIEQPKASRQMEAVDVSSTVLAAENSLPVVPTSITSENRTVRERLETWIGRLRGLAAGHPGNRRLVRLLEEVQSEIHSLDRSPASTEISHADEKRLQEAFRKLSEVRKCLHPDNPHGWEEFAVRQPYRSKLKKIVSFTIDGDGPGPQIRCVWRNGRDDHYTPPMLPHAVSLTQPGYCTLIQRHENGSRSFDLEIPRQFQGTIYVKVGDKEYSVSSETVPADPVSLQRIVSAGDLRGELHRSDKETPSVVMPQRGNDRVGTAATEGATADRQGMRQRAETRSQNEQVAREVERLQNEAQRLRADCERLRAENEELKKQIAVARRGGSAENIRTVGDTDAKPPSSQRATISTQPVASPGVDEAKLSDPMKIAEGDAVWAALLRLREANRTKDPWNKFEMTLMSPLDEDSRPGTKWLVIHERGSKASIVLREKNDGSVQISFLCSDKVDKGILTVNHLSYHLDKSPWVTFAESMEFTVYRDTNRPDGRKLEPLRGRSFSSFRDESGETDVILELGAYDDVIRMLRKEVATARTKFTATVHPTVSTLTRSPAEDSKGRTGSVQPAPLGGRQMEQMAEGDAMWAALVEWSKTAELPEGFKIEQMNPEDHRNASRTKSGTNWLVLRKAKAEAMIVFRKKEDGAVQMTFLTTGKNQGKPLQFRSNTFYNLDFSPWVTVRPPGQPMVFTIPKEIRFPRSTEHEMFEQQFPFNGTDLGIIFDGYEPVVAEILDLLSGDKVRHR